jgi:hypothetical protein
MKPNSKVAVLTTLPLIAVIASMGIAYSQSAEVYIGIEACGLFDGTGNVVRTGNGHSVQTSSNRQNAIHTCRADVTPPPDGRAVIFNFENTGRICGLDNTGKSSTDWQNVVSAKGKSKLVCKFRAN